MKLWLFSVALLLLVCPSVSAEDSPLPGICQINVYRPADRFTRAATVKLLIGGESEIDLEEGTYISILCSPGEIKIAARTNYSNKTSTYESTFERGKRYYILSEVYLGGKVRLSSIADDVAVAQIMRCTPIAEAIDQAPPEIESLLAEPDAKNDLKKNAVYNAHEEESQKGTLSPQLTKIITIFDFQNEGISLSESKLIIDLLFSELVSSKKYRVIDREKRDQILEEIEFSQSSCSDETCQLEAGKLLSADMIVVGSIGRVSNRYILNIKILEVETSEAVATSSEIYPSLDELVDNCRLLMRDLIRS